MLPEQRWRTEARMTSLLWGGRKLFGGLFLSCTYKYLSRAIHMTLWQSIQACPAQMVLPWRCSITGLNLHDMLLHSWGYLTNTVKELIEVAQEMLVFANIDSIWNRRFCSLLTVIFALLMVWDFIPIRWSIHNSIWSW